MLYLYVEPQGLKTGNDMHARDREDSTLKSHQFHSRKSTSTIILVYLYYSSTQQPYFEMLSSAALHLVPLSVLNCSVLGKILVTLMGWLAAVVRCDLSSCNPGCGVVATGRSAREPNQAAAFDPASNGVLQSQGQLLGWGGDNFLVWQ